MLALSLFEVKFKKVFSCDFQHNKNLRTNFDISQLLQNLTKFWTKLFRQQISWQYTVRLKHLLYDST